MMAISLIVALFTLGLGLLLTWPICIIWGAAAASSYNEKLMNKQKSLKQFGPYKTGWKD